MPLVVTAIEIEAAGPGAAERLEISVKLTMNDNTTRIIVFHTSIKKHMLYSYINSEDDYAPTPAAINTIARVNDGLFTVSFKAYVRHMCSRIVAHGDYGTFQASHAAHAMPQQAKGLLWGNDNNNLGGAEVHSFPSGGLEAVVFNQVDFRHFIKIMKFMYHSDDAARQRSVRDAAQSWAAIGVQLAASGLLSVIQLTAIRHKLRSAANALQEGIARERELGQAARALQNRPDIVGAKPFRSHG